MKKSNKQIACYQEMLDEINADHSIKITSIGGEKKVKEITDGDINQSVSRKINSTMRNVKSYIVNKDNDRVKTNVLF